MDLLTTSLRAWAQYREFKAVFAELESRSDAELAGMGLARGDIARVAYEEAERRIVTPAASDAASAAAPRVSALGRYRLREA